ncbi:unnamed protein product [Sympodiomycopsis kandeliae]
MWSLSAGLHLNLYASKLVAGQQSIKNFVKRTPRSDATLHSSANQPVSVSSDVDDSTSSLPFASKRARRPPSYYKRTVAIDSESEQEEFVAQEGSSRDIVKSQSAQSAPSSPVIEKSQSAQTASSERARSPNSPSPPSAPSAQASSLVQKSRSAQSTQSAPTVQKSDLEGLAGAEMELAGVLLRVRSDVYAYFVHFHPFFVVIRIACLRGDQAHPHLQQGTPEWEYWHQSVSRLVETDRDLPLYVSLTSSLHSSHHPFTPGFGSSLTKGSFVAAPSSPVCASSSSPTTKKPAHCCTRQEAFWEMTVRFQALRTPMMAIPIFPTPPL